MNMNVDEILLSIIIPVYNVENYLEKCVESVLSNRILSEIILVDDGSTDLSSNICDSLADKYQRVSVLHKANGGLSSARNYGLKKAKGRYVAFVDSDDWLEQGAYDKLFNCVKEDIDILKFSYCLDCPNEIISVHNILKDGIYERESIEKSILPLAFGGDKLADSTISKINLSATSNIYRRKFIENNSLEFVSEREVGSEDFLFNLEALICTEKIQVVDLCLYHYVQREGSLTKQYRRKMYNQYIKLCKYLYDYMIEKNCVNEYKEYYQHFYSCLMYLCLWNECNEYAPGTKKDKVNKVKRILKEDDLQTNIRKIRVRDLKSKILKKLIILRAAKIIYRLKSS